MDRPNPTAAMFDLDGTLLDTIEDLAGSMNTAVGAEGFPLKPLCEHNFMVGDGVRNYILRALPEDRRSDMGLVERVEKSYTAHYAGNWKNKTRPYNGIVEMLTSLDEAGIRLAVLSNKPDAFTREMVSHFLGDIPFEVVRGALDDTPLKPDPSAALKIAETLGVEPAKFLYLGDTATDMRTARSAGMFAVGCLWGFRPAEELSAAGADAMISEPSEFLRYL